jgi:perosamine synthetase
MSGSERPASYPVSSVDLGPKERAYVREAVDSGWISSIGSFVERFEAGFAAYCGLAHGVAVTNGTDALLLALRALGVGPGDEVVVPALTFAAVPAVVCHAGALPVIVDVDPGHWNLDPVLLERALTPRTKAVIVVHSYGHPAEMDAVMRVARAAGVGVIEDCAEAHGARCGGRGVGTFGRLACFSFYGNKIITTGEGGMVLTDEPELAARVRLLKDHAMHPTRRYYHTEIGYNCRMTNLQAALGCAQLERIGEFIERRARIRAWYGAGLAGVPGLALNPHRAWADPVNWMTCAVAEGFAAPARDRLMEALRRRGVDTRPFFLPVNALPPYAGFRVVGGAGAETPVAAALAGSGFNLPTYTALTEADVAAICTVLREELGRARSQA